MGIIIYTSLSFISTNCQLNRPGKLECLFLVELIQPCQMRVGEARSLPWSGAHERCCTCEGSKRITNFRFVWKSPLWLIGSIRNLQRKWSIFPLFVLPLSIFPLSIFPLSFSPSIPFVSLSFSPSIHFVSFSLYLSFSPSIPLFSLSLSLLISLSSLFQSLFLSLPILMYLFLSPFILS